MGRMEDPSGEAEQVSWQDFLTGMMSGMVATISGLAIVSVLLKRSKK